MGCTTPTCPDALGNESWEAFVAQHQTPLTLDHSCRAIDVIRQRAVVVVPARKRVPAAARSAPRSRPLHFVRCRGRSLLVSLGCQILKLGGLNAKRPGSGARRAVLGPSGLQPQCSILGWVAFGRRLPIAPGLGRVRLETTRARWAWRSRHQPCSFRMPFQLDVQREHPGPFVEADRLFGDPGGGGGQMKECGQKQHDQSVRDGRGPMKTAPVQRTGAERPRRDSNPRITDLQSVPLSHLGTRPERTRIPRAGCKGNVAWVDWLPNISRRPHSPDNRQDQTVSGGAKVVRTTTSPWYSPGTAPPEHSAAAASRGLLRAKARS